MLREEAPWRFVLVVAFIDVLVGVAQGDDITAVPEFGCQWTGGNMGTAVTCICHSSAGEFFIRKGSIPAYDTKVLKIDSCRSVRFGSNAISDMRNLRSVELSNIGNLQLDDASLAWNTYVRPESVHGHWDGVPALKVLVESSTVKRISSYTFQGHISSIIFRDTHVEDVAPFAFSSLIYNQRIEFKDTEFVSVQGQAFKKFTTGDLLLADSTFGVLPSRAFSDLTVTHSFQIQVCSFDVINSGAFLIKNPARFDVTDCKINILEGEGFKVETRGNVKIQNSVFNETRTGAFLGISLNKDEVHIKGEILFDSDTFNNLEKKSLHVNSTSFSAKFTNVLINQECKCRFMSYELEDVDDREEFQCISSDNQRVTLKLFKENNCSVLAGYSTIIIVLGVVFALFVIIFSGLLFYFKRVHKKQREYLTDKNGKPISLIMPDGRTYRETELHVVVERADLLTTDL